MINILKGIVIGMGIVIPGVSGSVIAILLGVYEKVLSILNNFVSDKKNNILYLSKISIGVLIGMSIFGNIILFLMKKCNVLISFIFVSLILGSIPSLINEIKKQNKKFNKKLFFITLILSFMMFYLGNIDILQLDNYSGSIKSILLLVLGGFLFIAGKIIPGISSSFFMMILGLYNYVLMFMSNPFNFTIYEYIEFIPFVIGCIIGFIVLIKFINNCLNKKFEQTYSCIIGFVAGSIFSIIPPITFDFNYAFSFLISVLIFFIMNNMSKVKKK